MTDEEFTDLELAAYLDESLSTEVMVRIESELRDSPALVRRLASLNRLRDVGAHTLGGIWRTHRLTCPPREQLGSFLLGALEPPVMDYVEFHVRTIGCRLCQANLDDLQGKQDRAQNERTANRRRKYFQTSAGLLKS